MMPWWSEWLARRRRRNKATQFVATLFVEPLAEDVRWLAANGTDGDHDHAQWELRYARRALGLLVAQRDALDDRTGSLVARELATALARDPSIASGKLRVAERQLNARLRAYGDALRRRDGAGTGWHLGRALLEFSGRREPVPPELVATAGDLLARYVTESNESLRDRFGVANLPEDVAPSALGAVTR
jgi:hypothetical protein